jgi:hypothetical protein
MSGWDDPTGGWDSGEEPEGARSDDQGYQQTQPTGGYRPAGSEGILRAGRRGLPGYDQAQNYDQSAGYGYEPGTAQTAQGPSAFRRTSGSDPLTAGGYDRGQSADYPAYGSQEASATGWSGADDQDYTQAFHPQQSADAGYGSLPGTGQDYRTQALGQSGYDQPGYGSQDYSQGTPGYQTEAYSRQGFESSGYAQRGYADQGHGSSGYGQASGGTGTGYQQDSYGRGAYAQDGYGQNGTQVGYGQDGYGQGRHSLDAYRQEGYGQDAYRQEDYGQEAYRQDGYGQDAYRQDGYGQEAYRQDGYGQDAYRQDAYGQDAHRQDAYRQDGYGQGGGYSPDAYRQDGYGQEAYRQEGYGQDAYRQDGYGQGAGYGHEAYAQPGIDRPGEPAYGGDGPSAPAPQSRSRSSQRSPQRLSGIRMVLYLLGAVVGAALIVLLVIKLSESGSTTTAGSTSSPSTSTSTGTSTSPGTVAGTSSAFVFTKAAKVGAFPLNPVATNYYVTIANQQATPYAQGIKAKGAGVPGKEVIAMYNLSSVTSVWADNYMAVGFVGFNGTYKPDAVIAYMKTQLTSTRMVSAGPHGGQMMCGYYVSPQTGAHASECLWVTPTTFGMVQFIVDRHQAKYSGTSAVALEVRNAVEVKAG